MPRIGAAGRPAALLGESIGALEPLIGRRTRVAVA